MPVFRKEVYLEIQAEQQDEPAPAQDDGAEHNGRREVDAALRSLNEPE